MVGNAERGITLIEITIVLTAVAILTAAAAPIAARTVDRARVTRALDDMQAIKTALSTFITELPAAYRGPKVDGTSSGAADVQILVSDGDIPREIGPTGDARWDDPVGLGGGGLLTVDFMENHLVQNEPFDNPGVPYPGAWRGAYLNAPIDPDPWGNRYAINTQWLDGTAAQMRNDTAVLSVGPDEQIDTAFQTDGLIPGDDDLIVVVRRDLGLVVP